MRVVIADDTALLREGLARLLADAGVEVCGEAADTAGLLGLVDAEAPDVAIVDIRMPPTFTNEGLVAAEAIHERHRGTGVLVLSQYVEPSYALRVARRRRGRRPRLPAEGPRPDAAELVAALERVAAGEIVVDPELVEQLLDRPRSDDPLAELTPREREVLGLMAEGLTDRGIAERLWLSPEPSRRTSGICSGSSTCRTGRPTTGASRRCWPTSGPRIRVGAARRPATHPNRAGTQPTVIEPKRPCASAAGPERK